MADIETTETDMILAKGSDGKVHDLHQIPSQSASGNATGKTEWFLSTGAKATTEDGVTFEVAADDLTLTKL